MSSAIAQLQCINEIPVDAAGVESPFLLPEPVTPRPELAGCKVRVRGRTPIYVIDRKGYRRLVPFPLTFMNLFHDSAVFQGLLVSEAVSQIAEGPALDEGAILVRGMHSEDIYLIDRGKKRLVTSRRAMDKYDFNEAGVVAVPQVLIDAIPAGEVWD
jgi:hypothetical protein